MLPGQSINDDRMPMPSDDAAIAPGNGARSGSLHALGDFLPRRKRSPFPILQQALIASSLSDVASTHFDGAGDPVRLATIGSLNPVSVLM